MAGKELATTRNAGVTRNPDGSLSGRVMRSDNGPQTEYIYLRNARARGGGDDDSSQSSSPRPGRKLPPEKNRNYSGRIGRGTLQSPGLIGMSWLAAMIIVSYDEWHRNGILPRPARLWYTSLTFGLLAIAGAIPNVTPLANAFAIGMVIVLLWQLYNKTGQFGG